MRIGQMLYPPPTPDEARRLMAEGDLDVFELSLPIRPEPLSAEHRDRILACGRELPGRAALHETVTLALAHRDTDFRRRLAARITGNVRLAGEAAIRIFTLHTTCTRTRRSLEADWRIEDTRWLAQALDNDVTPDFEESERVLVEFLGDLAPVAEEAGVTIALENNFRERDVFGRRLDGLADIRRVVDAVAHPAVRVCFDIYKAYTTEDSLAEAVRACAERIVNVHASDLEHSDTAFHRPRRAIGDGRIDWEPVLDALVEVRYDGPVIFELMRHADDVRTSAERLRAMLARTRSADT